VSATTQSPPPEPPVAPSAVGATLEGNGDVTVTWDTVANATGYEIGRSQKVGRGNNWSTIEVIGDTVASPFTDSAPGAGTYRYYGRAYNDHGTSGWSNHAQMKISDNSSGSGNGGPDCVKRPSHPKCQGT
jgi:hypothetical protein